MPSAFSAAPLMSATQGWEGDKFSPTGITRNEDLFTLFYGNSNGGSRGIGMAKAAELCEE